MIIPPPEVKEVVRATSELVSKNGKEMEMYIFSKEKSNPKFSFLNPNDPYHMFYKYCLDNIHEFVAKSKGTENREKKEAPSVSIPDILIENVHSFAPISLSGLDFDLVKLTALFSCINGAEFSSGLATRELRNPQFDFLKYGHSQNSIFTSLRKSYDALYSNTQSYGFEFGSVLERCQARARFLRTREVETSQKVDDEIIEKDSFERVDWHSFVIAEILDFTVEDRTIPLAPCIDHQTIKATPVSSRERFYGFGHPLTQPQTFVQNGNKQMSTKAESAMLPCPLCGLLIPAENYDEHIKLETISSQSSAQRSRFEKKHEFHGEEKSAKNVKDNISRIMQKRSGQHSDVAEDKHLKKPK